MTFVDRSGAAPNPVEWWDPVVIRREDIAAEIDRLSDRLQKELAADERG